MQVPLIYRFAISMDPVRSIVYFPRRNFANLAMRDIPPKDRYPSNLADLWQTEILLTPIKFKMSQKGS